MQDIWTYLKQASKPILIYGMGDGCDKILAVCKEKGISVSGIFASDEYVRDKVVHGFPLTSYTAAREKHGEMIVLLAFGVFRPDLMEKIVALSQKEELYAPEVPLFGGGLFDGAYYDAHKEELDKVETLLADEKSKQVFRALIEYKLTGKIGPLLESESHKEEDLKELIPFRAGDVYVDLGAYDGDTVLEWDALHPSRGPIFAFEPNPKTFEKLRSAVSPLRDVTPFPYAAWKGRETLCFNGKSGRSAALSNVGTIRVEARSVDEVCPRADFIKFDVEGAEKEALEGAVNTIRQWKCSLCVSAYHRTEDLFAIPLQVHEILPEYRIYLRHSPYIPAWDTQFYFVCR